MDHDTNAASATHWSRLVLIGLGAGILAGTFGVGGGILLVPLLIPVAGFDRHRAHATSLAAILVVASSGVIAYALAGEIDFLVGVSAGVGGVVGSVVGATVMHRISARSLAVIFAVVLVVAGLRMLLGGEPAADAAEMTATVQAVIGLGVGIISGVVAGLAGIGGGVIIVPALVLFLGLGQHVAQGTSLLAIMATAISASAINLRNKRLLPSQGVIIGAGGAIGVLLGARFALGADAALLTKAFGALVLVEAGRILWRAWSQRMGSMTS